MAAAGITEAHSMASVLREGIRLDRFTGAGAKLVDRLLRHGLKGLTAECD